MFGKLGDMAEMMKQAQKMQDSLKKIKNDLKYARYEAESNGVKVIIDGEMEIKELKITTQMDNRKMEDTVKHVINKALKQSKDDAANRLKSATGGISIPGLT
ncbi:YbaB/EbfC family nucleoid-associated protein [Candidatus Saganbacteria bacterium]|nr:YbaB/EbfC family nucleoid-associated protein [Candidatus Saganbacteria bacterium]